MTLPTCPFCKHPNAAGAKYCSECGAPQLPKACAACGHVCAADAVRCDACGRPFEAADASDVLSVPVLDELLEDAPPSGRRGPDASWPDPWMPAAVAGGVTRPTAGPDDGAATDASSARAVTGAAAVTGATTVTGATVTGPDPLPRPAEPWRLPEVPSGERDRGGATASPAPDGPSRSSPAAMGMLFQPS